MNTVEQEHEQDGRSMVDLLLASVLEQKSIRQSITRRNEMREIIDGANRQFRLSGQPEIMVIESHVSDDHVFTHVRVIDAQNNNGDGFAKAKGVTYTKKGKRKPGEEPNLLDGHTTACRRAISSLVKRCNTQTELIKRL